MVSCLHTTQWLTCRTWWWGRGRAARRGRPRRPWWAAYTRRSDLLVERDGGGEVEQHEGDDHVGHGELRTHDTTQWLTCRTWWWGRGRAAWRGRPRRPWWAAYTRSSDLLVERDGGGEVEHHEGDDHVGHGELRTHDTTQWLTCRTWWWGRGRAARRGRPRRPWWAAYTRHDAVTYL